jgi:hypothetical protein
MMKTNRSPWVSAILKQIEDAASSALRAEEAFRTGDPHAAGLDASAEAAHSEILNLICSLTDDEADLVEPAFTKLEHELIRVSEILGIGLSARSTSIVP